MSFHKGLTGLNIHVPYAWTYADATARLAATGFVAADVGKLAKQSSDCTLWILCTHSPIVWNPVSADGKENTVFMKSATPTVNDDNTAGYIVTDLWYYLGKVYILVDATTGAAVWRQLSGKHRLTTVNPTVNDDNTLGYAIEDFWVNETLGTFWICKSNATGAANWVQITNTIAGDHAILSNRTIADQHPISAITNLVTSLAAKQTKVWIKSAVPTVNDDAAAGYLVTDEWYYSRSIWICTDNTNGAAVWIPISGDRISQLMYPEVAITGAIGLTATAFGKLHHCTTSAAYTIILPTAVGYAGQSIGFCFDTANTFIVTVDGLGSQLIGTKLTRPYVHNEIAIFMSDGVNWRVTNEFLIKVGFKVTRSTVQTIPNSTPTRIDFDTEEYDDDNCFDSVTTYRFTPKAPGVYHIGLNAQVLNMSTSRLINISFNYSGVDTILTQYSTATNVTHVLDGSAKLRFNGTTDYLEGRFYQAQGADRDIQYPFMSAHRLSNV